MLKGPYKTKKRAEEVCEQLYQETGINCFVINRGRWFVTDGSVAGKKRFGLFGA